MTSSISFAISTNEIDSKFWSRYRKNFTFLIPKILHALLDCSSLFVIWFSFLPLDDSPSVKIRTKTSSPFLACNANVPPNPNDSSSGCALITKIFYITF